MLEIYIDTTQRYEKSVKLVREGVVISEKSGNIDVVSTIKTLLEESGISIGNVDKIIANPGPGSFTGIKLGITIANVINWALGKVESQELQKPEYGREPNISVRKDSGV